MKIFGAPQRYYQGPGVLDRLGEVVAPLGRRPLLVADIFVLELLGHRIDASLHAAGLEAITRGFAGEITYPAIDALVAGLDATPDLVVGIGGGKSLDAGKAVARRLALPVVTVPTVASNDSPTSAAIAMYDDSHSMIAVDRLERSPEAVLVDTALIAQAPVHFLRAGIGDAISKKFEAEACLAGTGVTPFGTRPPLTAIAIADACYRTLRSHAEAALAAAARGTPDDAFEATVEACVLMSGLGFENGGLSLAHSLTRGLVKARGASGAIHGAHVAWGLVVQLCAEARPDLEIVELLHFYRRIGLPTCLAELGMADATAAEIDALAHWTMTAPHLHNMPHPVAEADIAAAIHRAEGMAAATV